ncbi:hypothetical protein CC79DRAFT_1360177 [Sarocladium strictum]
MRGIENEVTGIDRDMSPSLRGLFFRETIAAEHRSSTAGTMNIKASAIPVTIQDWIRCQEDGEGLDRIKAAVEAERDSKTVAWISLASDDQLNQQWQQLQTRIQEGASLPLRGVPFAVKDNIDAAGFPTTAACPAFAGPPVTEDASVVANLKNAGAILIGKTNLDQFATGLVGTRSPYGAVPNSHDPSKVSGGSSSGSAVVVARGVVAFSLGTDTAGSGRVPAGLNNIIGLKPTRGALSARGVVPACRTLDCVSIFAMTTQDAETVLSVAESYDAKDSYSRKRVTETKNTLDVAPSVAICSEPPWFGQTEQEAAYNSSLEKAESLGWKLAKADFTPLFALANLLYEGPWVAERYEAIRKFVESVPAEDMDPTVRGIVMKANNFNAADAFAGVYERQELTRAIDEAFGSFDFLLVPTTPTFPSIADLEREPVMENSRLGTYTNFVNFLDWSALSVPAGYRSDGLPFGVTLIARTWQEPLLLRLAQQWLSGSPRKLGATEVTITESLPEELSASIAQEERIPIVVVGAHLSGLPLNKDLVSRGATFQAASTTSPNYRLYALPSTGPVRKPGIKRVADGEDGTSIQVESWLLPTSQLASFIRTIPHPLGLGSVELVDGSWQIGFICEPIGLTGATDVSEFGGWRAYMGHVKAEAAKVDSIAKSTSSIKKVLIANRGEIAVRIISTLKTMGIASVAIYSGQDSSAPHVRLADESFALKGHSVSETYLNSTQILDIAKTSGADAVIPGYGFLSENADFAEAVEGAGLNWIGPTPKQMRDLGLKHTSRDIASGAGVPIVPGNENLLKSLDEAVQAAGKIGFPLMLKSTAGGGGIGITKCTDMESLHEAWDSTQRLAKANFGNDGVFLEKFISEARHVEVQIIGDGNGKVVTVGERDCSLQRRHQKLVEESPAPGLSDEVRLKMAAAAASLASAVKYRNVGTVEFIYDKESDNFYFLEVNTRLQVEHPVTETVSGLDLVKCMVDVANGTCGELFKDGPSAAPISGASIEVRLYAESPLQQFRPTSGRLLDVKFPSDVRVDTWVEKGTEMSSSYDPLVAKIIAKGSNREDAIDNMVKALEETKICGIETNLEYLLQLVSAPWFRSADYNTNLLNTLPIVSTAVEVIEAGPSTTVQDYPGRKGLWHAGIPPSGPMDNYSARLANRAVGNPAEAAVLECSVQGPTLKFHTDCTVAVTGATCTVAVDGKEASLNQPISVQAGQVLSVGIATAGSRMFIAFGGGLDVPIIMGSRSTLELGKFGGHSGRKLQTGDILRIGDGSTYGTAASLPVSPAPIPTEPNSLWTIGAVAGPHGAPDYFTPEGLSTLFAAEWKVHYNSNRLGVRLTGPNPQWARSTGGQAGLHPSNIHDSPYSVGSVSFTGDEAVVLTCDGPSLGGFVVWCVVVEAEMWKLGQLRPGDRVKFELMTPAAAVAANSRLLQAIEGQDTAADPEESLADATTTIDIPSAIVGQFVRGSQKITVRQAGDHAMLLVFGEIDGFDLRQSLAIFAFIDEHKRNPIPGIEELAPGVRTLHVIYKMGLLPQDVLSALQRHEYEVPSTLPSRKIRLPFAFDDEVCKKAVERYRNTIRSEAPWLPSNIKFLQELNGLGDEDIGTLMHAAEFLVLGLGDVYMGSPCAVPLDPRHRLMGTKYNPSRSFTPRNAVGIGGQYMCIYATESPGGYQLVGRTAGIWDEKKLDYIHNGSVTDGTAGLKEKPWKFRAFDRISFYPVTEEELENATDEMVRVEENETLDLNEYEAWLEKERESIAKITQARQEAFSSAPCLEDLLRPAPERANDDNTHARHAHDGEVLPAGEAIRAMVPGRCFKVAVQEGDQVKIGDALAWVESNKMELKIASPVDGKVVLLFQFIMTSDAVFRAFVVFVSRERPGTFLTLVICTDELSESDVEALSVPLSLSSDELPFEWSDLDSALLGLVDVVVGANAETELVFGRA